MGARACTNALYVCTHNHRTCRARLTCSWILSITRSTSAVHLLLWEKREEGEKEGASFFSIPLGSYVVFVIGPLTPCTPPTRLVSPLFPAPSYPNHSPAHLVTIFAHLCSPTLATTVHLFLNMAVRQGHGFRLQPSASHAVSWGFCPRSSSSLANLFCPLSL